MSAVERSHADVLREAKALISDPAKWIKGASATIRRPVDGDGDTVFDLEVEVDAPDAFCFCAGGAIERVANDPRLARTVCQEFGAANRVLWPHTLNDRDYTTHADVMAAFDRAIEYVA